MRLATFGIFFLVLCSSVLTAQQSPPFTCVGAGGVPVTVRGEGLSELLGDFLVTCTGGSAGDVTRATISVFLNTEITSRTLEGSATEALLVINEPASGAVVVGQNAFRGVRAQSNRIVFADVPIRHPGFDTLVIRLTNIRANVVGLRSTRGDDPAPVVASVLTTGAPFSIFNSTQIVGFVLRGYSFELRTCDGAGPAAAGYNASNPDAIQFNLQFSEGSAVSFRRRSPAGGSQLPAPLGDESGYTISEQDQTGRATQGVRLIARFNAVPAGTHIAVTTAAVAGAPTSPTIAARLINADAAGSGEFSPAVATGRAACGSSPPVDVGRLVVQNNSATAVWEITEAQSFAIEKISFGLVVSSAAATIPDLLVSGKLGPLSGSPASDPTAPAPRFADRSTAQGVIGQRGLTFTAVAGGAAPPAQRVGVLTNGQEPIAFEASAAPVAGGSWIAVTPARGISDGLNAPEVEVRVDPRGLAPGFHYGRLRIDSRPARALGAALDLGNPVRLATIALRVLPAGSNPGPLVEPAGLLFGAQGASAPAPRQVLITTLAGPAQFQSRRSTTNGRDWFSVTPASGAVTPGQPLALRVDVIPAGLAAGQYGGTLALDFSGGARREIDVRLIVAAAVSSGAATGRRSADAGCPSVLIPVFTSVGSFVNTVARSPVPIEVDVLDNCRNPLTGGSVTLTFSNGDPPLPMKAQPNGRWTGTWVPPAPAAQVFITATAVAPASQARGSARYTVGAVVDNEDPPVLEAVVSAASFQGNAPLAPGEIVSIFGTALAGGTRTAGSLPLPDSMDETAAIISARPVPLFSTSAGQLNAVLPLDLEVDSDHDLIVLRGGRLSAALTLRVVPAKPAVFTKDQSGSGQGAVVVSGTRTLGEPASPLKAGDVVEIYATGLGTALAGTSFYTNTAGPAPGSPPAIILQPPQRPVREVSVRIGEAAAEVVYAGLTVGSAGLYQVNARVPSGVTAGDAVPLVLTVDGRSSPPVTVAIR